MNEDSKTFCMFPWIHLSIQPDGEVLPCCNSSPLGVSLGGSSLHEVWNSQEIKNLRLNMMNNIKSSSCEHCYTVEDVGQESPRQIINKKYHHHLDIVETTKNDGTVDKLNIVYWDFRFSNVCNFKCRMCGPVSSSSWYEDYQTLIDIDYNNGKIAKIDVLNELESLFESVEEVYFAGGEPLIMDEHYYILDKLIEFKKTNIPIVYSSNLSTLKYKEKNILDIWKNFKNIIIGVSLDGHSKRGEVIRNGMKWNTFLKNLALVKENAPQAKYTIGSTVQALNGFHIMDTQRKLFEVGLLKNVDDFRLQFLNEPEFLSLQILDDRTKEKLCKRINYHIKNFLIPSGSIISVNDYESMINYINLENKSHLISMFIKYCSALDSIRNENTIKTFPELKNLWNTK